MRLHRPQTPSTTKLIPSSMRLPTARRTGARDTVVPAQAAAAATSAPAPATLSLQLRPPLRRDEAPVTKPAPTHVAVPEAEIGAWSAVHPVAGEAAKALVWRVWATMQQLDPSIPPEAMFGSFRRIDGEKVPRRDMAGDVDSRHVQTVMHEGNLRERMTLAFNAMYPLQAMLATKLEEAEHNPELHDKLSKLLGSGLKLAKMHLRAMRRTPGLRLFDPDPRSSAGAPMRLRSAEDAALGLTTRKVGDRHSPPLSTRELESVAAALGDLEMSPNTPLPFREGRLFWKPDPTSTFIQDAVKRGIHVAAGLSRTTLRLMTMAAIVGATKEELTALRLACVGYLVPDHHSVHEIMAAAKMVGVSYKPSPMAAQSVLGAPASAAPATPKLP